MAIAPIQVLLIEDSSADLLLLRKFLKEDDDNAFVAECAGLLDAGLEQLTRGGLDVVVLDLNLPDSSGLESLRRVIEHAPTVPVIVLTGAKEEGLALDAMRGGAQDFLVKGQFSGEGLKHSIRHAIERCRIALKIRQRDAHLQMLTEQLPAILWTTDRELRITSSWGAALKMLNLEPHQIDGASLNEYFQTNNPNYPPIAAHVRALQGQPVSFETTWMERTYQSRVEPLRQGSHVVGAIGVAVDITDDRRIEEELRIARQIQQGLLPRNMPVLPGLEFGGSSHPAVATGGDFFDCMMLRDGTVGLVIGDTSGHGFGPALLAAVTHASLRTLALTGVPIDIGTMLATSNRLLCSDAGDRFVTLFFARFDPASQSLTFCNAGHPPGLILDAAGEVIATLKSCAVPLGLIASEFFPVSPDHALAAGQLLVVVTDGVLEATAPDGTRFGMKRVLDLVRASRDCPAPQIAEHLCQAARAWCQDKPQRDDITAVIVKAAPQT